MAAGVSSKLWEMSDMVNMVKVLYRGLGDAAVKSGWVAFALLVLVVYGIDSGNVHSETSSSNISELNSAELFTRPGIADFGFPVGALWLCLSRLPTGAAKIVETKARETY
jgi:hypothetical protein